MLVCLLTGCSLLLLTVVATQELGGPNFDREKFVHDYRVKHWPDYDVSSFDDGEVKPHHVGQHRPKQHEHENDLPRLPPQSQNSYGGSGSGSGSSPYLRPPPPPHVSRPHPPRRPHPPAPHARPLHIKSRTHAPTPAPTPEPTPAPTPRRTRPPAPRTTTPEPTPAPTPRRTRPPAPRTTTPVPTPAPTPRQTAPPAPRPRPRPRPQPRPELPPPPPPPKEKPQPPPPKPVKRPRPTPAPAPLPPPSSGGGGNDPNSIFLQCCQDKKVPSTCLSRCNFDTLTQKVLTAMFLGSDVCPRSAGSELLSCAASEKDHTSCCVNNKVTTTSAKDKCLGFCNLGPRTTFQVDVNLLPCWAVLENIKTCYKDDIIASKG